MIKVRCHILSGDISNQKMPWRPLLPSSARSSTYRKTPRLKLKSYATSLSPRCQAMTNQKMSRFRVRYQTTTMSISMPKCQTLTEVSSYRKFMRIDWVYFSGRMLDTCQDSITSDSDCKNADKTLIRTDHNPDRNDIFMTDASCIFSERQLYALM